MIQNIEQLSFAQIDDLIAQLKHAKAARAAALYRELGTLRATAEALGVAGGVLVDDYREGRK